MAQKVIHLEIITPRQKAYSEEIDFLKAPAVDGLIGVLPDHAPLVTALATGVLWIEKDEDKFPVSISKGFMEVQPDNINVVVRSAELPNDIDAERAREAKKRAEERLGTESDEIDRKRAEAALERAEARIEAAEYDNIL